MSGDARSHCSPNTIKVPAAARALMCRALLAGDLLDVTTHAELDDWGFAQTVARAMFITIGEAGI